MIYDAFLWIAVNFCTLERCCWFLINQDIIIQKCVFYAQPKIVIQLCLNYKSLISIFLVCSTLVFYYYILLRTFVHYILKLVGMWIIRMKELFSMTSMYDYWGDDALVWSFIAYIRCHCMIYYESESIFLTSDRCCLSLINQDIIIQTCVFYAQPTIVIPQLNF